jgi:hypothetical protein
MPLADQLRDGFTDPELDAAPRAGARLRHDA